MESEQTNGEEQIDAEDQQGEDPQKPGVDEEGVQGAKGADNPEPGKGTGEGEGGLGSQTGALGGGEPVEPEGRTPPDQLHPHGESGR